MLYRFRSTRRLLESGELEGQYFYFASPDQQNDPMEGYVDFRWKGDRIAWLGLFKHYVWQMYMTLLMLLLGTEPEELEKLFLGHSEIGLKDTRLPEKRREVERDFAGDPRIAALAAALGRSGMELAGPELKSLLLLVNPLALHCAARVLERDEIELFRSMDWLDRMNALLKMGTIQVLERALAEQELFRAALAAMESVIQSMELNFRGRAAERSGDWRTMTYLLLEFPEAYVRRIPWLSFPDWYCVCFNDSVSNPALWGYYGDGHRGVCLMFRNEPNGHFVLTEPDGGKPQRLAICRVRYGQPPPRVDFFRSLGWLWGDEREHWLIHDGEKSQALLDMFADEESWRKQFRMQNLRRFLSKSAAWAPEREYRIVLDDLWDDHRERRTYRYDFQDLAGIVFGIKTPVEEKLRIMEIIGKKCAEQGREEFDFFQARYRAETSELEMDPIPFVGDFRRREP